MINDKNTDLFFAALSCPIIQNFGLDRMSNEIYTLGEEEVIELANRLQRDNDTAIRDYVLKRYFQFMINQFVESEMVKHRRVKNNFKANSKTVDLFIDQIPFDIKITVIPKRGDLPDEQLINWYYKNQGKARAHYNNKIFIVFEKQVDKIYSFGLSGFLHRKLDLFNIDAIHKLSKHDCVADIWRVDLDKIQAAAAYYE